MNLLKSSLLLLLSCGSVQSFTASSSSLASLKRTTSKTVNLARPTTTSKPSTSTSLAVGTEIVEPSYNLALGSLALGAAFGVPGSPLKSKLSAFLGGIPLTLFGLFLAFQTTTLRFTLDDDNFSLVKSNLESTGENVVVGGENVWAYKSFVNYDVFPDRNFPILIYFKETQTPEDQWDIGPGEQANSEEALAKGAVRGQVHFFPAIGNTEQLIGGFEKHDCAKLDL
eukprot:CAMPEP_0201726306 /NCGR_PEP_ID=MMETSP0593-20130828/9375_1 /ASSEMBLY_ACC=CAM_ASM_000672 /TAXON_ID=267983 /ORGANISM="Skeletonema japonicum, Strain CCMP2506" /LENGTH=225 /DNA_ID=CAMNT_0048217779 /DNA_START=13 /DNA_END=690 /DNA_ORIENTATION=-